MVDVRVRGIGILFELWFEWIFWWGWLRNGRDERYFEGEMGWGGIIVWPGVGMENNGGATLLSVTLLWTPRVAVKYTVLWHKSMMFFLCFSVCTLVRTRIHHNCRCVYTYLYLGTSSVYFLNALENNKSVPPTAVAVISRNGDENGDFFFPQICAGKMRRPGKCSSLTNWVRRRWNSRSREEGKTHKSTYLIWKSNTKYA